MMIPDRKLAPGLNKPEKIEILRAEERRLDNGLSIYVINSGEEDVVKLEIIFPTGVTGHTDYTTALASHQLIDAGTSSHSAPEIAESLDYYGAYLQTDFGPDWKHLSLFTLSRFFDETLGILDELLTDAAYPEAELATWKTRNIQALQVNREKVSWLAKSEFSALLFGARHPYGFTPREEDILALEAISLRDFFRNRYHLKEATVIVSGKVSDAVFNTINRVLGKPTAGTSGQPVTARYDWPDDQPRKITIDKKDAVQSGIRIGKRIVTKTHPDFPALLIANTVLGGYFGSRLMTNIREDKGYTYGIGSGIHPHLNAGFFYISTEAGIQVKTAAVEEIYKELKRLATEPVPPGELELVTNYLVGAFQRSLDGPFSLADRFKGLKLYGLTYDFLENYLKLLHSVTPERILEVVSEHLQPDTMTEVIAG